MKKPPARPNNEGPDGRGRTKDHYYLFFSSRQVGYLVDGGGGGGDAMGLLTAALSLPLPLPLSLSLVSSVQSDCCDARSGYRHTCARTLKSFENAARYTQPAAAGALTFSD